MERMMSIIEEPTDAAASQHMRRVVWFSCGAASAVAARLLVDEGHENLVVAYCDTSADEHPDNERFLSDVEEWIGHKVLRLRGKFSSVDEVFERYRYMAGVQGARCTVEMKKVPRFEFQLPDDVHTFGFTSDEVNRIDRFTAANPGMMLDFVLQRYGLTKDDCLQVLTDAGIELPALYSLGYKNNNCLGCVKATSARYWNMVRRDFPDVFEKRARQSRELGVKLTRVKGTRVFLDALPSDYLPAEPLEDISCGPDCNYEMGP